MDARELNSSIEKIDSNNGGIHSVLKQDGISVKMETNPITRRRYINWLVDRKQVSANDAKKIAARGIPKAFLEYVESTFKVYD